MELCTTLFNSYLDMVTVGYFNHNEEAHEDVTEYREIIGKMKKCAIRFSELELLQKLFGMAITGKSYNIFPKLTDGMTRPKHTK